MVGNSQQARLKFPSGRKEIHMAKLFSDLRMLMVKYEMTQAQLARRLNCGLSYVSDRMVGNKPWSQTDMYAIMDLFGEPHEKLHLIFPPLQPKATAKRRAG